MQVKVKGSEARRERRRERKRRTRRRTRRRWSLIPLIPLKTALRKRGEL